MNRIGGYEPLTEMKTVGSGSARWCIARREDQRFFLKEFLSPVHPPQGKDTPLARKQLARCQAFERRKRRLYAALSCVIGETLVPVLDFFRHEGRYYAVSEEVPWPHISGEDAAGLSMRETRLLLYDLAECLRRLHTQGIIHADLKPEHLLLTGKPGRYRLRLIDLDSGFLEEEPPSRGENLEGDPVYLSPEVFLRLTGEEEQLTTRLDTFAMGMLIHRLWAGELPAFDTARYAYLYEAVLAGGEVRLSPKLPLAYRIPVQRMLRKDPAQRPPDEEIVALLSGPWQEAGPIGIQEEREEPLNGLSRYFKRK